MKREDLIRHQFDGLTSEIYNWECLTPTAFLKEDVKKEAAEKELIFAYLRAAEFLYIGLSTENNPVYHVKVFKTNQICMPFLYVCRHALELSIKLRLRFETQKSISGHKLSELYYKLTTTLSELKSNQNISLLIEVLNEIDDDGCKLRYSKDIKDKEYQKEPTFIRADNILKLTKRVCNELIEVVPKLLT